MISLHAVVLDMAVLNMVVFSRPFLAWTSSIWRGTYFGSAVEFNDAECGFTEKCGMECLHIV